MGVEDQLAAVLVPTPSQSFKPDHGVPENCRSFSTDFRIELGHLQTVCY